MLLCSGIGSQFDEVDSSDVTEWAYVTFDLPEGFELPDFGSDSGSDEGSYSGSEGTHEEPEEINEGSDEGTEGSDSGSMELDFGAILDAGNIAPTLTYV